MHCAMHDSTQKRVLHAQVRAADGAEDGAELTSLNDLWLLRPVPPGAPVSAAALTAAGGTRPRWTLTRLETATEAGCETSRPSADEGLDEIDETGVAAGAGAGAFATRPTARDGRGGAAPCGRAYFAAHWRGGAVGASARGGAVCGAGGCLLLHGGLSQGGRRRGDIWVYGALPGVPPGAANAAEGGVDGLEPKQRQVAAGMPEGDGEEGRGGESGGNGGGGAAWRGAAWRLVRPSAGSAVPRPTLALGRRTPDPGMLAPHSHSYTP